MNTNDRSEGTDQGEAYLRHPVQTFVFEFREPTAEDLARPRYGRPDRSYLLKSQDAKPAEDQK